MELFCHTHDVLYDVERARRKCKQLDNEWDEWEKLVEEKDIECNYQQILRFIVGNDEMHEHHRRGRDNVIYIDEDDSDDENDPQYELFLSRLKEHGNSYVLESENNGVPVFIKYEAESGSEDESEQDSDKKMMACADQIVGLSIQEAGLLNNRAALVQHGSDMHAQSDENSCTQGARILMNLLKRENVRGKESELSTQKPGSRTDRSMQNQHDHHVQVKSSAENSRILKSNRDSLVQAHDGLLSRKSGARKNWLTDSECDYDDQARLVEKEKVQSRRKSGKMVRGNHGADIEVKEEREARNQTLIQMDDEYMDQDPVRRKNWAARNYSQQADQPGKKVVVHDQREVMKLVQGDHGLSNKKTAFGNYSVKNETDDSVRTRSDRAGIHNNIKSVEAAQCSVTYIDSDEDNLEKEGDDEIVPEVEILDSAAYIKKGILSPFVPSKSFHKSMMDDDFQNFGRPSASDEFRQEVLEALRKPYDREEYKMQRKALRDGSYLDHHPDLGKKLKKNRYNRRKCLTILRGFFFWLQNLTREGSFQPWKDAQCLAVEPPSP